MDRFFRLPSLETILWILASIAALVALLVFVPSFMDLFSGNTSVSQRQTPSRPPLTPTPSRTPTLTPVLIPPTILPQATLPFPTPPSNAQTFVFLGDPRRTGWISSGDPNLHVGDRNLHAGSFKGQTFQSILSFDLAALAPGSKITYAQIELTGLSRNNVSTNGKWTMQFLSTSAADPNADLGTVVAVANVGSAISDTQLGEGQANRFVFTPDQLSRLEESLNVTGKIYLRMNGPSTGDNLFTWDAGDRDPTVSGHPTLRINAIPALFSVITNTPTPANVVTAAADIFRITEIAKRGTLTPFPRSIATATPLVVVTAVPTPANAATATAVSAYATAVAVTTGTFTPTPPNFITATPRPLFIPIDNFTPVPTATPTLARVQSMQRALPPGLVGKIMFLSGSRDAPFVYIMDGNGKNVAQVTDPSLYDIASTRDQFSPNGMIEAFNAPDPNNHDILQIFLFDFSIPGVPTSPNYNQLTSLNRGIAFSPAWSPDSGKIAYTSTESGKHEIISVDLATRRPTQLTNAKDWNWNQYPSWSPDGKQIVFSSDRARPNTFTEISVMNADGTGAYRLLDFGRDAWAPVWIKWNK